MDALARLGLSPYQQRLYTALVKHGSATAHELSQESGVPYTAVYQNMEELLALELCHLAEARTKTYVASAPERALKQLASKQAEAFRRAAEEAAKALESSGLPVANPVSFSTGAAGSREASIAAFEEAERSIHVLGWYFHKAVTKGLRIAARRAREGLDVRLITPNPQLLSLEAVRLAIKDGVQVRYKEWEKLSFVIVDKTSCKITLKGDELPERVNIHVDEQSLAHALDDYFEKVWEEARPLQ